jgi:hypothetical protein
MYKIQKVGIKNKNTVLQNSHGFETNVQREIIHILKTIIEQNYFQVDQEYYKQTNGLAMGAPTSSVLAEIYIQHTEHYTNVSCPNRTTDNRIFQIRRRLTDNIR